MTKTQTTHPPSLFRQASQVIGHVPTFVWLRYRISMNQLIRANWIGKVFAAISLTVLVMTAVGSFAIGVVAGVFIPRAFDPADYFVVWSGMMGLITVMWLLYVLADIQRTDAITFDRVLHLPVSVGQAFVVNYVLSLIGVHSIAILLGVMGFVLGSCFSVGPRAVLALIPFACFFFAFSAIIYQFQGWFATLMANPRRRQTIMILLPLTIITLTQLPAIVMTRISKDQRLPDQPYPALPKASDLVLSLAPTALTRSEPEALAESSGVKNDLEQSASASGSVQDRLPSGSPALPQFSDTSQQPAATIVDKPTAEKPSADKPSIATSVEPSEPNEGSDSMSDANETQREKPSRKRRTVNELVATFRTQLQWLNLLMPPLWVAACVDSIFAGNVIWLGLCFAMSGIGWASLRRNYRATMRYYLGETDGRAALTRSYSNMTTGVGDEITHGYSPDGSRPSATMRPDKRLGFFEVPFVSHETDAVMQMTWRTMRRAPEVKMFLLMPFLAPFVLLGVFRAWRFPMLGEWQAIIVVCFCGFNLLISAGLIGNQFGFDRSGFRAFVLSPIRRDRIFIARNLATSPLLLFQILFLVVALSLFASMAIDKVAASLLLSISMLPSYYLLMNLMSILTPFPLAAGSIQPTQFGMGAFIMNLGLSMVLPIIVGMASVPLLLEWAMDAWFEPLRGFPIALVLSLVWVAIAFGIYRILIPTIGNLLMKREKDILQIVTSKIE